MNKRFMAVLAAILLALFVTPAFAEGVRGNSNQGGSINAVEDRLLAKFDQVMTNHDAWFSSSHHDQYKAEARAALLDSRIDLDSDAEAKFNDVLDQIDAILDGCSSDAEAWKQYGTIAGLVNGVSKGYHMTVSADASDHYATVMIDGTVAATTTSPVRQTGFGLGQTAAVVAGAAAVLAGAFFFMRKNQIAA